MKPRLKLVDLGIDLRWRITDLTGSRRFAVWLFTIPLRLAALLDLILITLLSILHFGLIRTAFLAYIVALVGMEAPLDASARLHAASEAHAYAAAVLDFADHALNAFVHHYGLQRTLADLSKPLRALADLELELVTLPDWSTKYEASVTLRRVLSGLLKAFTEEPTREFEPTVSQYWRSVYLVLGLLVKRRMWRVADINSLADEIFPGRGSLPALQTASAALTAIIMLDGERPVHIPHGSLGSKLAVVFRTISVSHTVNVQNMPADEWADDILAHIRHLVTKSTATRAHGLLHGLYGEYVADHGAGLDAFKTKERLHDAILDDVLLRDEVKREKARSRGCA